MTGADAARLARETLVLHDATAAWFVANKLGPYGLEELQELTTDRDAQVLRAAGVGDAAAFVAARRRFLSDLLGVAARVEDGVLVVEDCPLPAEAERWGLTAALWCAGCRRYTASLARKLGVSVAHSQESPGACRLGEA